MIMPSKAAARGLEAGRGTGAVIAPSVTVAASLAPAVGSLAVGSLAAAAVASLALGAGVVADGVAGVASAPAAVAAVIALSIFGRLLRGPTRATATNVVQWPSLSQVILGETR